MAFRVYHQIERYKAVQHAIGSVRKTTQRCSFLEIGAGRHGNLMEFFPNDDILLTDIIYTPEDLQNTKFMIADATCLPFADNSYDYVIGLDMLEHVSAAQRPLVIKQALRVARCGVFFSFPHDSNRRSTAMELCEIYKQFGYEPPCWVYEHEEMKLPAFEDMLHVAQEMLPVENIYTAHGVNAELNRKMLRLEAYTSCNPAFTDLFVNVSNTYAETLLEKDMGMPLTDAVKSYLLLSKEAIDEEARHRLDQLFKHYEPDTLKRFGQTISQRLNQQILEHYSEERIGDETMEMKEMATAVLEVANRLDQIMEKMDELPASAKLVESQKNVAAYMEQLLERADKQEAAHTELINTIQQNNMVEQIDRLNEQVNQQTASQRELINAVQQGNVNATLRQLVNQVSHQSAVQDELMKTVQHSDMTAQMDKLITIVSQQCASQATLADAVEKQLEWEYNQRNRIILNVILITYNQEKYIRTTLQSILDQKTDFSFNIIVADDCSKDRTFDIIKEMEATTDIPFIYLDHSKNHGIMQNYKRAFAACDADYVAIMEGDDIWVDPYRLQKHKDFLEKHPECSMSFNQFIVKNFETGEQQVQPAVIHENYDTYRLFTGADLAFDNLIGNFSTCVYKNAYLQRLPKQLYDVHAYDWLTNIFIAQMGFVGCLLQPLSIYRIHSAGIWSQKKQEDKLQEIIDLTIIYDKLTNNEFTLGFTAHRERLEAQLRALKAGAKSAPPAPQPLTELQPAVMQPVQLPRKTLRGRIKKILIHMYRIAQHIANYLPPIIVTILKYLIPPCITKKLRNMKEV